MIKSWRLAVSVCAITACGSTAVEPNAKAAPREYVPGKMGIVVTGVDREALDKIVEKIRTTDKRDVEIVGLSDRLSYAQCRDAECRTALGESLGLSLIASVIAPGPGTGIAVFAE